MAMELKVNELSFDETRKFYNENNDFKEYVQKYSSKHRLSVDECLRHLVVRTTAWVYREMGNR